MYNADNTVFYGQVREATGKTTNITSSTFRGELTSVQVLGVDDPTNPERARDELVLRTLMGECTLWQWDFVRYLWQPSVKDSRKLAAEYELTILSTDPALVKLNPSQTEVVLKMTTEAPLVIVHGKSSSLVLMLV
jgi:regulator of nonsense transcripts 1